MSDSYNSPTPQFSTAEYAQTASDRCQLCQQPIGATYYRVNGAMACLSCAESAKMRNQAAATHGSFARALIFGIGAAVAGMIGYALVAILLQGWVISYMSIGVGWLVGTAMLKGSNGVGGKLYQFVAGVLTYAAVSMAAIPIWIHFAHRQVTLSGVIGRLGWWIFLGLASPFAQLSNNPFWGVMGVLILFFGMQIAWRITAGRPSDISGPFAYTPRA
jgi:hypothetical protein